MARALLTSECDRAEAHSHYPTGVVLLEVAEWLVIMKLVEK